MHWKNYFSSGRKIFAHPFLPLFEGSTTSGLAAAVLVDDTAVEELAGAVIDLSPFALLFRLVDASEAS